MRGKEAKARAHIKFTRNARRANFIREILKTMKFNVEPQS